MTQLLKKLAIYILSLEACILLKRFKPTVIAITGSVGKTTTKDLIVTILKEKYTVRGSIKSYNSETGIPLTILGLLSGWHSATKWFSILLQGLWRAITIRQYPTMLVLEAGIEEPGDMARVVKLIQPDMTVLTQLAETPVHVAQFENRQALYDEKELLITATKERGTLVFNINDSYQHPMVERAHATIRRVSFGGEEGSMVRCVNRMPIVEDGKPVGSEVTLAIRGTNETFFIPGALGFGVMNSLIAAVTVGVLCNVSVESMRRSVASYTTPPGRMRIVPGVQGSTILDDSYNASPIAAVCALEELGFFKESKRIVVFGEMIQLGDATQRAYTRIGEVAAECADIVVTVGEGAFPIAESAVTQGAKVYRMENSTAAKQVLDDIIDEKTVVLFKGSQVARMEKLLKHYVDKRIDVKRILVRQEDQWQKTDMDFFLKQ